MKIRYLFLFLLFALQGFSFQKKHYDLKDAPIDVVIPCHPKDLDTLDLCIDGIRKYGQNIRRVIVVSSKRLTQNAEWYNEANYPFSREQVMKEMTKKLGNISERFFGWYYQQLLKLYALNVIPKISPNVLCLDSDTVFLNPVSFISEEGGSLFNPGYEYHKPYFEHISRFAPGLKKVHPKYSGISHHMLFQKPIMDDLFAYVEKKHEVPFWIAFFRSIPLKNIRTPSASEYEIYFNYALSVTDQVQIRLLKWDNVSSLEQMKASQDSGVHYISAHTYMRKQP